MAKTNAGFKLGKMVKLSMGATYDPEARRVYKEAMISAELSYISSKNRKYTELKSNPNAANSTTTPRTN